MHVELKCPVCDTRLAISERTGVEIDHCPRCRGMWVERGGLERLNEHSGSGQSRETRQHGEGAGHYGGPPRGKHWDRTGSRKRKSLFGELLDFD